MSRAHGSRVRALLEEGVSVAEVARRIGVTANTVRYHRDRSERTRDAAPPSAPIASTRTAVAELLRAGCSRIEVARRLGIGKSTVSYHAARLGMEIDGTLARRFDWPAIQLYYDAGHSVTECRELFGFSASAWTGAVKRGVVRPRPRSMSIEELLAAPRGRDHLKRRLLEAGLLPRRCEQCGIAEWRGRPLALQLHHVNGDRHDNRLENLQILCPNCHSQTGTWARRNGRREPPERDS